MAAAVLAAAPAGCSSPCQLIQERMCECLFKTTDERNSCETSASTQSDLKPPTDAQQAQCEALLPGCTKLLDASCDALNTPDGQKACGISR